MDTKFLDTILEDEYFPYEKMSKEERKLCLKFLLLTNPFFCFDTKILQCHFIKESTGYNLNGLGYFTNNEKRDICFTFNTKMDINNNSINIFSIIDYLYEKTDNIVENNNIQISNKFIKKDKIIIRQTYNEINKKIETELDILNDFDKLVNLSNMCIKGKKQR